VFTLRYSDEKNRIYIKIDGALSEAEINTYKNNIIDLIDHSKMGFTVLADFSRCDRSILDNSDNFNVIREYGAKRGFKANALVLKREFYDIYCNVLVNNKNIFITIEDAENYLDTL
jgi:oligoendopeptidase F